jgi:plasmid stabilization system protein ParE
LAFEKQSPGTAARYIESIIEFGDSLSISGKSLKDTRYKKFIGFKSISFRKTYIIFFKVTAKSIYICRIIHGKALIEAE